MSFDRLWHWFCDFCGKEEVRREGGFPKGWVFETGKQLRHACPECEPKVNPSLKGYPQIYAKE